MWAYAGWRGTLFRAGAKPADFLAQYAQAFNAVEGNSTFYALPSKRQVANWQAATSEQFRFCFKMPRLITHDLMLQNADQPTQEFLQLIAPLGQRLGPIMIQLGPGFSTRHLPRLQSYLASLSAEFLYSVEVRHADFFEPSAEIALDNVLLRAGVTRCHFDTQCIHRAQAIDESTKIAKARKPVVPRRSSVTSPTPLVRIVGQNYLHDIEPEVAFWSKTIADWLGAGLQPYVFTHTPDDRYASDFAKALHAQIQQHHVLPDLPDWPGSVTPQQADLFGS